MDKTKHLYIWELAALIPEYERLQTHRSDIAASIRELEEKLSNITYLSGALRALTDSPGALEEFYLSQTLKGLDYGPEELAALCELVTVDDVRAVCAGMELDAVYFLHGDAEDGDPEDEEAEDDAAD